MWLVIRYLYISLSCSHAESLYVEVGVGYIYYIKGVTVRFGFDVLELRNFRQIVKNKATGTPHGMFIYNPHWSYVFMAIKGKLYTHQRGAFDVARFDNLGNAKALTRGTSDRTGSTFLFCIYVCLTFGIMMGH